MCKQARIVYRASNPNGRSVMISRLGDEYIVQFFVRGSDGATEYLHLSDYSTTIRGDAFTAAAAHLNKEYA